MIGSILYFTTGVADRNNKIMYEDFYNTSMNVVKDDINTTNTDYDTEKMVIVNKKAIL